VTHIVRGDAHHASAGACAAVCALCIGHDWKTDDTISAAPPDLRAFCRYESAEMYWRLYDCGVPVKHLVYNKVGPHLTPPPHIKTRSIPFMHAVDHLTANRWAWTVAYWRRRLTHLWVLLLVPVVAEGTAWRVGPFMPDCWTHHALCHCVLSHGGLGRGLGGTLYEI